MAFNMRLWQVQGRDLTDIAPAVLDDEKRLEDWVAKNSSILGIDILLIGRQITTNFGGRIDLLGIDANANLVVLELKRDKTPRDIVAQALDYGSWVKDLSYEQINNITEGFLNGKNLRDAFREHFDTALPETVNANHSMIILASELDDSSERIVEYLSEQYEVPINVIFFTFFQSPTGDFLGRAWLLDPEAVQERTQSKKQAPWPGYYFVNVGEGMHRNWDDCLRYGFISAGQGTRYSQPLKNLKPGDLVFAYLKGLGYVGYGKVAKPAVMVQDFIVEREDKKLLELPLVQPNMKENKDNAALSEWVIGVNWIKTFCRKEAKTFTGVFANQNIVCRLRQPATVEFLKKEFELP